MAFPPDPSSSDAGHRPGTELASLDQVHAELMAQNEELRVTRDRLDSSRREHQILFDHSPVGQVVLDGRGWVLRMNESSRRLLGLQHPLAHGGPLVAWIDKDHHRRFFEHLRRLHRTGTRQEVELLVRPARPRTVRAITEALDDQRFLVAMIDITEIREAEIARQRSESRHRRLFAVSRDAQIVFDASSGRILEANPAAAELLGLPTPEDVVGRHLGDYIPSEQQGAWRGLVGASLDDRHADQVVELTLQTEEGTLLAEVRVSQVEACPPTLLVNIRDVRDRRKLKEERSALETRLSQVEKMEALGTLAGGIAHDMNNMLTAVRMAASSLADELPADSAPREDAEAILSACTRFSRLVENLLGFARRRPEAKRSSRVADVVSEVHSLVEARLRRAQVRFETELPELVSVDADPARLTQSIMNLVLNAIDELPPKTESAIRIDATPVSRGDIPIPDDIEGNEFVRVTVSDNGPGMSPKVAARAFDPFFTTKPEGKGTGLGLAVVYRNTKQAGGWVTLDTAIGEGTRVHVHVPQTVAPPRADSIYPAPGQAPRRPTVLVVEDEDLVAKSVARFLRRNGFAVEFATNGREGVTRFEETAPDVVLLDVVMPEMDGPTCARHLRAQRPEVPILFYSAHLRNHGLADLRLDERTGFLEKPFEFEELRRHLLRLIRKSDDLSLEQS